MGSLLAVLLVTGCNADDQDPPPEDDGLETPGEDFNNNLDNDVTPEEDVVPGDNDMNNNDNDMNNNDMNNNGTNGDGNAIGDNNNDGDLDIGKDDDDNLGDNEMAPGGGTGGDNGGTNGAGGGK